MEYTRVFFPKTFPQLEDSASKSFPKRKKFLKKFQSHDISMAFMVEK